MTITDRDRAAALACNGHNDVCKAIAQAREEVRAELDAERAAHAKTSGTLALLVSELAEACGWEDKTPLHAALHAKNAVLNLKADVAAERAAHEETKECLRRVRAFTRHYDWCACLRPTAYENGGDYSNNPPCNCGATEGFELFERLFPNNDHGEETRRTLAWRHANATLKARLALAEALDTAAANFLAPQRMGCTLEELRAGVVQMAHTQPDPRAAADTLALIDALAAWRAAK